MDEKHLEKLPDEILKSLARQNQEQINRLIEMQKKYKLQIVKNRKNGKI